MKKENDKKIKDAEIKNVSGGYKQNLFIIPNYGNDRDRFQGGSEGGDTRETELSLTEALSLFRAGEFGNPDVEEKLRGYGFKRESSTIGQSQIL